MKQGKVIVIGGDGNIGRGVFDYLESQGHEVWKTTRRPALAKGKTVVYDGSLGCCVNLSLEDPTTVIWAIGASGYARCRDERESSHCANVTILEEFLAKASSVVNFVYLSSTAVFDSVSGKYHTDSPTAPTSEYGRQKEAAEKVIRDSGIDHSVLRLGKVLDPSWPLLARWRNSVQTNKSISAFSNLTLSPILPLSLAKFMESILTEEGGQTYHCSNTRLLTYQEFAHHVVKECGGNQSLVLEAISQPEMTDGGAVAVDIVPSEAYLEYHVDPMTLPPVEWFS